MQACYYHDPEEMGKIAFDYMINHSLLLSISNCGLLCARCPRCKEPIKKDILISSGIFPSEEVFEKQVEKLRIEAKGRKDVEDIERELDIIQQLPPKKKAGIIQQPIQKKEPDEKQQWQPQIVPEIKPQHNPLQNDLSSPPLKYKPLALAFKNYDRGYAYKAQDLDKGKQLLYLIGFGYLLMYCREESAEKLKIL